MSKSDEKMEAEIAKMVAKRDAAILKAEREAIIACIRSTTWSGSEEIVTMIRNRKP